MKRCCLLMISMSLCVPIPAAQAGEKKLELRLRQRVPEKTAAGESYKMIEQPKSWSPKNTAIIVCDMWDTHHSNNAVNRVNEMAPRMNEVLEKARSMGMLIIHSPSGCL